MANSIEHRVTYRLRALAQILFPLAILVVGLMVMFFVVGYFIPLVQLIERLI